MGLDQTLKAHRNNDSEIIVEWRKQYWIDDFFMKLYNYNEDGKYLLSSEDVISLKRFCELCLKNPKMKQIVSKEETISDIMLIKTVNSINVFINTHNDLKDYKIYYTQSF